jgi:hypothetical protein
MEKNFTLKIIALIAGLFISFYALNLWQNSCNSRNKNHYENVTRNDTIVVLKARIDTLKLERIKLKTIYEKDIETIYLMPDDAYSIVSSSWVKNLVGCRGWVKVIENAVTPFVLNELKKQHLKKTFIEFFFQ